MCDSCRKAMQQAIGKAAPRREVLGGLGAVVAGAALGLARGSHATHATSDSMARATPIGDDDRYHRFVLPEMTGEATRGSVAVTFLGTTTLLFDAGDTQLLIDGFFTRPSLDAVLGGPIQTDIAVVDSVLSRAGADHLAALFVAHSHWDHALDVAYVATKTEAQLFGSISTLNIGRGGGAPEAQMTLFEPGRRVSIGFFTVTVLPSKHSPQTGEMQDIGQFIAEPLRQPALATAYVEGDSFDFLIEHNGHSILVKPSANFIPGALDDVSADVLFLATATLGVQDQAFQNAFYEQTVGKVRPSLVVPIHWDNFFLPLNEQLEVLDPRDIPLGFDFLIERLNADDATFGIMPGYRRILVFDD